jgi:HD-like signal output (HDOD) protein
MSTLDSFFATVKLPTISEVAQELIKTLNDEDTSVTQVSSIISRDPALTAKLLRLANSASFGLQRSVGSVDEAIAMIGMAKVRTLSLASCMSESFPVLPGLNANEFWKSSMTTAGYAQWMAGRIGADTQQAWLTGMTVRLGELLMGQADPAIVKEIEKLPHQPGGHWEREKQLEGFSEGQVTGKLTRRWNFPTDIVVGLQQSFEPLAQKPFSRLAAIIHLADLLADTPTRRKLRWSISPKTWFAPYWATVTGCITSSRRQTRSSAFSRRLA